MIEMHKAKLYILSILRKSKRFRWHVEFRHLRRRIMETLQPYYNVNSSDGKCEGKEVVCILDDKFRVGGITDRLRGAVSTYMACKELGVPFRLLFNKPFVLSDYLVPNKYNWYVDASDVCYDENSAVPVSIVVTDDTDYQKKKAEKLMLKEINRHPNKQIHIYTDSHACYLDNHYHNLFNELFKPSEELEKELTKQKNRVRKPYIAVVTRFQQLLGDFVEADGNYPVLNDEEKNLLIGRVKERIEQLHTELSGEYDFLCTSDSYTFLQEIQKLEYVNIVEGRVVHPDSKVKGTKNEYMKTFLDMLLIADASEIYLLKTGDMFDSGFPYAASLINQRPFHRIVF